MKRSSRENKGSVSNAHINDLNVSETLTGMIMIESDIKCTNDSTYLYGG